MGILLSVCSTGLDAIAENNDKPQPREQTTQQNKGGSNSTADKVATDDEPYEDVRYLTITMNPNAIYKEITGKDLNITTSKVDLWYGQTLPNINEREDNNIFPKYYSIKDENGENASEWIYNYVTITAPDIKYPKSDETTSKMYEFTVSVNTDEFVMDEDGRYFTIINETKNVIMPEIVNKDIKVRYDFSPDKLKSSNSKVNVSVKSDRENGAYLEVNNENFKISLSPKLDTFTSDKVYIKDITDTPDTPGKQENSSEPSYDYDYYLRYVGNEDKNLQYKYAVSRGSCSNENFPEIFLHNVKDDYNIHEENGNVFYNDKMEFYFYGFASTKDAEIDVFYKELNSTGSVPIPVIKDGTKEAADYYCEETRIIEANSQKPKDKFNVSNPNNVILYEKKVVVNLKPEEAKTFYIYAEIKSNNKTSDPVSYPEPRNGKTYLTLENIKPIFANQEYIAENGETQSVTFLEEETPEKKAMISFLPTDEQSGLKTLEYSIDGLSWKNGSGNEEGTWVQNTTSGEPNYYKIYFSDDKSKNIEIDLTKQTKNGSLEEFRACDEGKHVIDVKITDKSGNEATLDEPYIMVTGYDYRAPEIREINILKYNQKSNEWVEANPADFKQTEYGNHVTVPLRFEIDVYDPSDQTASSPITSVSLNNLDLKKGANGKYYYDLTSGEVTLNSITATDAMNNSNTYEWGSQNEYDIAQFIDFNKSAKFVFDDREPEASITKVNFAPKSIDGVNRYGYAERSAMLTFNASDNSGIAGVKVYDFVVDEYEAFDDESFAFEEFNSRVPEENAHLLANIRYDKKDTPTRESDADKQAVSIEDLEESRNHVIVLEVEDNVGLKTYATLSFYIDFTAPKGEIKLVNEDKAVKLNKNGNVEIWFNDSDDPQFLLTLNDDEPRFINWKVESTGGSDKGTIKVDKNENSKVLNLSDTNAFIEASEEHSFMLTINVEDMAGNKSSNTEPFIIYKDLSSPKIRKINVEKKAAAFEQILRVLTFGIFSNDKIRYSAEVSDYNDIGVDRVEISFNNDPEEKYYRMNYNENKNIYTLDIPFDDDTKELDPQKIYSGDVIIRAYDKMNKETRSYHENNGEDTYDTVNSDNGSTKSPRYIVEQIEPVASFDIPVSDSVDTNDERIWYNSDKNLKIGVQDKESGIQSVSININDKLTLENDTNGEPLLTTAYTEAQSDIDTNVHPYELSTEAIKVLVKNKGDLPEDGHYVIRVNVTDNSGNDNSVKDSSEDPRKELIEYYIDETSPVVNSIDFSVLSADGYGNASSFIEYMEYGYYFMQTVEATVNISDPEASSGLNKIEYRLVPYKEGKQDTKEIKSGEASIVDGKASFEIPAEFKGQIYVKGYDNVGNVSKEVTPQAFIVDTPEKHTNESHFDISFSSQTSYRDGEGNRLYDTDVVVTVKVIDTMSGIRSIKYNSSSEKSSASEVTVSVPNTGNKVDQSLDSGWRVTAMDENLVTEISRDFAFSSDDNNIQLSFEMTDRSNNTSTIDAERFSIDKTAPVISVSFDEPAGNGKYYREDRTATVTVTERNFDASKINNKIQNTYNGNIPSMSFSDNSSTEHVAVIVFREGDYIFNLDGEDRCGHTANSNMGGTEFVVDKTNPNLTYSMYVETSSNSSSGREPDLSRAGQTNKKLGMQIEMYEHNFESSLTNIHVYRAKAGTILSESNREDCTSKVFSGKKWSSSNDIHTIRISFPENYIYQLVFDAEDKSGRQLAQQITDVFEIDTAPPKLKNGTNRKSYLYDANSTETTAEPIVFADSNISEIKVQLTAYQMVKNKNSVGYQMKMEKKEYTVEGDTVVLDDEYFQKDGIYEMKCVAYDIAGNASEETVNTYVVQRESDFLVYIPDSDPEKGTGLYEFDKKGIRSAMFPDINMVAYILKSKEFGIEIADNQVPDDDIDSKVDADSINEINKYELVLKNSYISQNYNSETVDVDLPLNAVAQDENGKQTITLGHIYIDNVKPAGEYEESLRNLEWYEGFYDAEGQQEVSIVGVSPDIDDAKCEVYVNDKKIEHTYHEEDHTITFMLSEGNNNIRTTLVDKAGNQNALEKIDNVYVGSFFAHFWYLFALGALLIIGVVVGIVLIVRKVKKSKVI